MQYTLNMYPNLQYNPVKIQDFTILEFYKDNISALNKMGYYILPIQDLTVETIRKKIENLSAQKLPEGYSNVVALPDRAGARTYSSYNHRICYVVYYNGDDVPTYPSEPTLGTPISPKTPFNPWNEINISNIGAPTPLSLILTVTAIGELEFYINDNSYKINNITETGILKMSKNGVFLNDNPIIDFSIEDWPFLKSGDNIIKMPKNSVSNIQISYKLKY